MERSNFASLDAEVANDISGTECEPRLVRVLTGKCGKGVVFVIKIGNLYFEMWQKFKDPTGRQAPKILQKERRSPSRIQDQQDRRTARQVSASKICRTQVYS